MENDAVIGELSQKVLDSGMPAHVEKIAVQEIETLARTSPSSVEYSIGINYLDYLVGLPWNKKTLDSLDLAQAKRMLDEDHYGLYKTKERILEHLAVRILRMSRRERVLIVDDEDVARKNLSHVLERDDCEVFQASSGEEALRKLGSSDFDIVITDLRMPGIDGMEILERVKAKHPGIAVIMITGYATVETAVEAMKKGAFNYITKPFKLDDVRTTIKQAVEKRAELRRAVGSVLCFAGPPGTGKTSVGISIARGPWKKICPDFAGRDER